MNILIIPSFIFSKHDKTLGSFVFEQAIALKKAGNNVYMVFCDTYSAKEIDRFIGYSEQEVSEINGVVVIRDRCFCPLKHDSGFYGSRESFSKHIINLYKKHLADIKFDLIHAHCCAWAGYAAMQLSRLINIPYVVTEHSSMYSLGKKKIKGKQEAIIRTVFSEAKSVICVSAALQSLISPYRKDVTIIGNVVDCDIFGLFEEKKQENGFTFLSVCYMKHMGQFFNKGMDLLISAFSRIVVRHPDVQLRIGGGGKALKELEQWIDEKNIRGNVSLIGALSRQEVAAEMKKCDVFVLPSRYETFGVVYAEALACGKPVIGTKTGGPDSFVNVDNGILIDTENEDQLVDAMEHMIANIQNYDCHMIRTGITNRFSMEAIAKQLMEIYAE